MAGGSKVPKRIHYYLLLVLLGLVAAAQMSVLIVAALTAHQPTGLVGPDLWLIEAADASVGVPVRQFLQQVVDLRHLAMALSAMVLLLCVGAVYSLRYLLAACEAAVEEARYVDLSEPVAKISTATMAKLASSVGKARSTQPTKAGSKHDVEQLSAMVDHLVHKAQHDALTGLPNRSLALDRMKQMLARAERHGQSFAVLFLDLNGFKRLNDTYGHEFGDKVLRKISERLTRSVRSLDTVARLGGDEFLIILDQVDASKAMETAQTLSTIVRQPVIAIQGPVSVGVSTGIAVYPQHGADVRQLLRAADAAMYLSKRHSGQPAFAIDTPVPQVPPPPQRSFDSTTTTTSRLLETWQGTIRGLRSLNVSLLGERPKE